MWDFKDLFRTLSKLVDLTFDSHFLNRIFYVLDVYHSFVSEGMEEIEGFYGLLSSLLIAKDQINPFMKIFRDNFRLQGSSIDF